MKVGRVVKAIGSSDGLVGKVLVKTRASAYTRPINKLVLVHAEDLDW